MITSIALFVWIYTVISVCFALIWKTNDGFNLFFKVLFIFMSLLGIYILWNTNGFSGIEYVGGEIK